MNYYQILSALIFDGSILLAGFRIKALLESGTSIPRMNRSINLVMAYMLGYIPFAGIFLCLSLLHLYKGPILVSVILLGYIFLFSKNVRLQIKESFDPRSLLDAPNLIFIGLIFYLGFRNSYFLVTGDTHNIYLFIQKLWLENSTALVGNRTFNFGIFTPHANALPYSLGIFLFGQETLFAQYIELTWKIILISLAYGYTKYRFNGYYGLIAAALVMLDEHVFYSGVNAAVIINCALASYLFASCVFFYEAREKNCIGFLGLGLIFLSQLPSHKYQSVIAGAMILIIGLSIQPQLKNKICSLFKKPVLTGSIVAAILITCLWLIKNFILTGCPTFPVLASKFGAYNWIPEMEKNFQNVFGSLGTAVFFKYLSYFFVWHGVLPAKIIGLAISLLPLTMGIVLYREKFDKHAGFELCYWLSLSILTVFGFAHVSFLDPRSFRYPIGLFAFTATFLTYYLLSNALGIKGSFLKTTQAGFLLAFMIVVPCLIKQKALPCRSASVKENTAVLTNQLHMNDAIQKYYPDNLIIQNQFALHPDKTPFSAWDIGTGGAHSTSSFLAPIRPQVGLWVTSTIDWDSYKDPMKIADDLNSQNIKYVMSVQNKELLFMPVKEYAQKASQINRYPKNRFYDYGFPQELAPTSY